MILDGFWWMLGALLALILVGGLLFSLGIFVYLRFFASLEPSAFPSEKNRGDGF